jgi:hypothetical protein
VEQEYNFALNHQVKYDDFKIIPVVIDETEVPGFLQNQNYIQASGTDLSVDFYDQLLRALYPGDIFLDPSRSRDIYVSRTWRDKDAKHADQICRLFIDAKFRLIGDSKDHPSFKDGQKRVDSIIGSCGGLLAVLPYREESPESGNTSSFMLEEIRLAIKHDIRYVILMDKGVVVPDDLNRTALKVVELERGTNMEENPEVQTTIEMLSDHWKPSRHPHQIFFAANFENPRRNHIIERTIQRITAMNCITGDNVRESEISVQQAIVNRIRNSFLMLGDISGSDVETPGDSTYTTRDPVNTLIELGIARGAGIDYYLMTRDAQRRPPFMFRDGQLFNYKNDAEMIGLIHSLVYPFRRRVLNYEIHSMLT